MSRSSRPKRQSKGSATELSRSSNAAPNSEAVRELLEVTKDVGAEDLALDDGELDLALVQPRGMDGQVDEPQRRPLALEAFGGTLAPVTRAVVHDPKDPLAVL